MFNKLIFSNLFLIDRLNAQIELLLQELRLGEELPLGLSVVGKVEVEIALLMEWQEVWSWTLNNLQTIMIPDAWQEQPPQRILKFIQQQSHKTLSGTETKHTSVLPPWTLSPLLQITH